MTSSAATCMAMCRGCCTKRASGACGRIRPKMRTALIAAAALLALLSVSAIGQAAPKKEIVVQIRSDIRSTEPGVNRDAETDTVMHHIVESLVAFQEDLDVAPLLAEKVDVSSDQRVYTFTLRNGLVFHNGQPV